MNLLFITKYYYPHVGGVEKHVNMISKEFKSRNHTVSVVTWQYDRRLPRSEFVDGIRVYRIKYPEVKFIGIFCIWLQLVKLIKLFTSSDIVHIHDVVLWCIPLRILMPSKKLFATFHGWETKYPIPKKNIILRKISCLLVSKSMFIGRYIEKYYGVKADYISYGGVDSNTQPIGKKVRSIVFVGRLSVDTGIPMLLDALDKSKNMSIVFCGDGPLKSKCEKYGKCLGFVNPSRYLAESEICVAGGYLSVIEAMSLGCKVIVIAPNRIRVDMFSDTPFTDLINICRTTLDVVREIGSVTKQNQLMIKKGAKWVSNNTWRDVATDYLRLWGLVDRAGVEPATS